jgi:hypothetical protein
MPSTPVSPTVKGLTTIVWGTNPGGASNVLPIGVIVDDYDINPTNQGPVGKIENGDGSLVAKIYLDDGFEGSVTFVYDTTITYPAVGDPIVVKLPSTPAGGGVAAAGAASKSYNCTVDAMITPKGGRKKEAMATIKFSYNPGVLA